MAQMTELDRKLQEIAVKNWEQFAALIGEEAITGAKICLLRQQKFTYGQIQNKLNLTKNQVEYRCNNCEATPS